MNQERLDELARCADQVAEEIRGIESVPGETWVVADWVADEAARLAHELRTGAAEWVA